MERCILLAEIWNNTLNLVGCNLELYYVASCWL